jgi:hypothetical protein
MTDATVGQASIRVGNSSPIYRVQVWGRWAMSQWHSKASRQFSRSGIRVVVNNTQSGEHGE